MMDSGFASLSVPPIRPAPTFTSSCDLDYDSLPVEALLPPSDNGHAADWNAPGAITPSTAAITPSDWQAAGAIVPATAPAIAQPAWQPARAVPGPPEWQPAGYAPIGSQRVVFSSDDGPGPYSRPSWSGALATNSPFEAKGGGPEITTLWIGDIPAGTNDRDMQHVFSGFGQLLACFVIQKVSSHGQMNGFARYSTRAEASLALENIRAKLVQINGQTITSTWAKQNCAVSTPRGTRSAGSAWPASTVASGMPIEQQLQSQLQNVAQGPGAVSRPAVPFKDPPLSMEKMKEIASGRAFPPGSRFSDRPPEESAQPGQDEGAQLAAGLTALATAQLAQDAGVVAVNQAGAAEVGVAPTGLLAPAPQEPSAAAPRPSQPAPLPVPAVDKNTGEELGTIWVGDVQGGNTDQDLQAVMRQFGKLLACFLLKKVTAQGMMSGFVRYEKQSDAAVALGAIYAGTVLLSGKPMKGKWATENSRATKALSVETRTFYEVYAAYEGDPAAAANVAALQATGSGIPGQMHPGGYWAQQASQEAEAPKKEVPVDAEGKPIELPPWW